MADFRFFKIILMNIFSKSRENFQKMNPEKVFGLVLSNYV